ncbi:MAG: DUF2313 domain-containing protein [Lachnospiraceae bacterium]|nr:DUF2313 domain-containing protein [Lachnospiraceae bacterium]
MEEKFDIENFPTSKAAKEMLHMVSEDFYATSYVGKWLFQVLGIEWDEIKEKLEELPQQLFIETATWGLKWHEIKWQLPVREYLTYEERRQILYAKRDFKAPMTPYLMEKYIRQTVGVETHIYDCHDSRGTDWVAEHPNMFQVDFISENTVDIALAKKAIEGLKQSHTKYVIGDNRMITIDETGYEEIETEMILGIKISFWGIPRFDGIWKFDGENRFIAQPTNNELAMSIGMKFEEIRECIGAMEIITHTPDPVLFNGEYNFDGTREFDTIYRKEVIT